ncbi:MAG: 3-methyladenine DNA glycosylase [Bacteroidetes bacterium]|jgi:3-methyladenine DNA glycosylase AlkC|nr:3-methyladenine DNA glycosylase [Bacteroidota bacterium]
METQKPKQLKDWFGPELAKLLSAKIAATYPAFKHEAFQNEYLASYANFELKDRVNLMAGKLQRFLPNSYEDGLSILMNIIGPENENETGMFTEGYWLMPVARFIEIYGIDEPDISIRAINELTKRHTGEFAIRPFIETYPEKLIPILQQWATDANFHVRRLASEGLRPRLPWAKKLTIFIEQPEPVFQVLAHLMKDPVMFVKKSVANNLNDYLKDNETAAWTFVDQWKSNENRHTQWILNHALRNKIKIKDPKALKIIGSFNK